MPFAVEKKAAAGIILQAVKVLGTSSSHTTSEISRLIRKHNPEFTLDYFPGKSIDWYVGIDYCRDLELVTAFRKSEPYKYLITLAGEAFLLLNMSKSTVLDSLTQLNYCRL